MITYLPIYVHIYICVYKQLLPKISAKNVSLAAMWLCTMKGMIFEQKRVRRILARRIG